MAEGTPILVAEDVYKAYGGHDVLCGVSLSVMPGEVIVLAGRSGAGKSTFLRCLNHLETIDRGRITVCGHPVGVTMTKGRAVPAKDAELARQRRDLGMVFQNFNLFPHMTALDNIMAAPLHVLGTPRAEADAEARRLLKLVDLPEKADAYPQQLSGGQQQRVAIARALAMKPRIMLFDEPTSALDPEMIREVLDVMSNLSDAGMTMIVVTHEMGFARAVADRIVLMHNGLIVEDAKPDAFFEAPKSDEARQLLMRLMPSSTRARSP